MRQHLFSRVAGLFVLGLSLVLGRADFTQVKLNEIFANNTTLTNADGSITDLLELYNTGVTSVDLGASGGCSLSDSNSNPRRYVFPPGSVINAGGYKKMTCDSSKPASINNVNFGIKASGGYFFFYGPFDTNTPISQIEYGIQCEGFSIGCVPDTSTNWVLCTPTFGAANSAATLGLRSMLKVNEWMANPSSGSDYFELYNPTNLPIDISTMFLTDNLTKPTQFRVRELSFIGIGPMGGFLKFDADNVNTNTAKYPCDHVNFSLAGSGETVALFDVNGVTPIDYISWTTNNPGGVSQGRLPDGSANIVNFPKINDYTTASPGEPNYLILPYTNNVIVNELLSHTDPPFEDAIEFKNRASTNFNISGWWLSNQRGNRRKFQLPVAPAIPPNGFRVIYEGATNGVGFNSPGLTNGFTFNSAHGDQVVLSQVDGSGNLTGYILYEEFESAANGVPFIHYDTSVPGDYKFVAESRQTFGVPEPLTVQEFRTGTGATNAYPKIGPLVINEIMYAPSNTIYGTNLVPTQNPDEEYIEILNITTNTVPLYDPQYPTNHWKLKTAVSFIFPFTNVAPNEFFLVVGFDPNTNAAALDNFRSRHGVSNSVHIYGPWSGRLSDGGDAIELYRPDPVQLPPHPDAGFVPFIRIDKVNYASSVFWPAVPANSGFSLQRKNPLLFGNDPINWAADAPNAGRGSVGLQDTDGDGIPDVWEDANGLNKNSAADASQDPDNDGISNLGEYLAGTNPHNSNSVLRIMQIFPLGSSIIESNVPAVIRFLAYSNASYTVQYRNSLLPSANWQTLEDVPSAPSNRVVEVQDPNAYKKTDRYYRIVAPAQF